MTISEKLRLVQGMHSHAEIFGFKWDDDSDWTWRDVACKIADEVDAENAKLRDENARLLSCLTDDAENARQILGESRALRDENAKLREESGKYHDLYVHAITDAEVWHLQWSAEHQENAKLRELAHLVTDYVSEDQCDGCVAKRACNAGELDMCWIRKAILEKLRELGVEVDS